MTHTITIDITEAEGVALAAFAANPDRVRARHETSAVFMRLANEAHDNLGFEAGTDPLWHDCESCDGTGVVPFMAGSSETCSECMGHGGAPDDRPHQPHHGHTVDGTGCLTCGLTWTEVTS